MALNDAEPEVRRHALSALWDKAKPRSNEVLHIALHDTDPEIRRHPHELLQEISVSTVFEK
jgi:hypothetical protein